MAAKKTPRQTPKAKSDKKADLPPTEMMPTANGGSLRIGNPGNKGGTGRPTNEIRELMRESLHEALPKIHAMFKAGKVDPIRYADMLAKYGVGTKQEITGADDTPVEFTLSMGHQLGSSPSDQDEGSQEQE